jgi:hypothetical protein
MVILYCYIKYALFNRIRILFVFMHLVRLILRLEDVERIPFETLSLIPTRRSSQSAMSCEKFSVGSACMATWHSGRGSAQVLEGRPLLHRGPLQHTCTPAGRPWLGRNPCFLVTPNSLSASSARLCSDHNVPREETLVVYLRRQ